MPPMIRFAAFVEPGLIHILRYRRDSAAIEVLAHDTVRGDWTDAAGAATALAELVLSTAGRGQRAAVSVVIRRFNVQYRLLRLPPAGADVLRPVVEREMIRLLPEIEDPVVDFVVAGRRERRIFPEGTQPTVHERRRADMAVPPAEVLAASAPGAVVRAFAETLDRHEILLEHLTIPAQALTRLYDQVNGKPEATAVALMLPGGPLVTLFQKGELRFIAEPPASVRHSGGGLQALVDQLIRGRMYLRQHFRGEDITRVLLAAEPEEYAHVNAGVAATLEVDVGELPVNVGPPAAIAALGAALDAGSGDGLTFYPSAHDRRLTAAQGRLRSAVLAAAVVAALALGTALFHVVDAHRQASRLEQARRATSAEVRSLQAINAVVASRRENQERLRAAVELAAGRQALARAVLGLTHSTPAMVTVSSMVLRRESVSWRAEVSGSSSGFSAAGALRGVSVFQNNLAQSLPGARVEVVDFDQSDDDSSVTFRLTITIPDPGGAES